MWGEGSKPGGRGAQDDAERAARVDSDPLPPQRGEGQGGGPSVVFVSLEHELLARMDGAFDTFARAERFKAQRGKLTREAEALIVDLLRDKGRSGTTVVLGDTAILGVCDALHLVRKLYDETNAGGRGFWITVVPGVMYQKQPMFLERTPLFHLESTLPMARAVEIDA